MDTERRSIKRVCLGLVAVAFCLMLFRSFVLQDRLLPVLVVLVDRGGLLVWALLILAAALGIGCRLLRGLRLRPDRTGAEALFGFGTGLGVISLLTLGAGAVGLVHPTFLALMLFVLLIMGLRDVLGILRAVPGALARARKASYFRWALWGILGLFLLLNLTRAFEPPWDYDSLEYHVAAPAAYDRVGRVCFLRDNVYANFPQGVEMLYFLGTRLTGSPDRGAVLGRLLGAAMGFLAALALRELLAGLAGREVAEAGAVIFYTWPGVTVYSGVPYVELPLIFYGTLALWGILWSWRRKRTAPGGMGWVLLGGMAAGMALGVKYTAALLVLVPLTAWLGILGLWTRVPWKETARRCACFAGVSLLVFSPWLVRNAINTGNPVYPLLYGVFGGSNWDAQKDARWTQAHSPNDRSLSNLKQHAREVVFFDERKASLLLFLFIPLALLADRRTRGVAVFLAVHAVLLFFLWFMLTQQNVRFLEVGVTGVAALSALGFGAALKTRGAAALKAALVLLALFAPSRWVNYLNVERSLGSAVGAVSPDRYFAGAAEIGFKHGYAAMKFINDEKNLPPGSKVLFLGEARTFYCRRDYVAATVFDTQLLEGIVKRAQTVEDIRQGLKSAGVTHLYVNTFELLRLQESYRYSYQGREHMGMLDGFNWDLFDRFAQLHLQLLWPSLPPGSGRYDWAGWDEFLQDYVGERTRPARGHIIALYALR